MAQNLRWALDSAKEGNKLSMEFNLKDAKMHAINAGALPDCLRRSQEIRKHLGNEKHFYAQEMAQNLRWALISAKEGNKLSMEFNLKDAKKHAINAGALPECQRRSQVIRKHLGNEQHFYAQEMAQNLRWALDSAKEGNKLSMEFDLKDAKKHAIDAGALPECQRQSQVIRKLLGNEKHFYAQEMAQNLRWALDSAKEGNKLSMEFNLKDAKKHATTAGCHDMEKRITDITPAFYAVKPETKLQVLTCGSTRKKAPARRRHGANHGTSKVGTSGNDEIVVVQEALTSEEIIANRMKRAESNGEIINLP